MVLSHTKISLAVNDVTNLTKPYYILFMAICKVLVRMLKAWKWIVDTNAIEWLSLRRRWNQQGMFKGFISTSTVLHYSKTRKLGQNVQI